MDGTQTTLERAFELARSGKCLNITDVKRMLAAEGYSTSQLDGPSLRRQLGDLIRTAKAQTPAPQ